MPRFKVDISWQQKGAIFNASQSQAIAKRMVGQINEALAQEGVNRVKSQLRRVLQNPSGFYESRITTDRRGSSWSVWDQGVVYGGWLEGVDPRNSSSRFKGYSTFRRIKQELDRDSEKIAQPAVNKFVQEMNG